MPSSRRPTVLLVRRHGFELFSTGAESPDGVRHVVPLEDDTPRALARAVTEELAERGLRGRAVVLALGSEHLHQRQVALPQSSRRERQSVWDRRASGLLECAPGEATYVAVPLFHDGERTDDEGEPWMLYALHRSWLHELQVELRRAGVQVRRVVLERLSLLAHTCQRFDDDLPYLLVARERGATTLNLLRSGRLIQQTTLSTGEGVQDQGAALALVQELRNLSTHWRRTSRGQQLGRIVLLGFTRAFLEPLMGAIHAALGGVEIETLPRALVESDANEPSDGSQERDPTLELLRACLVQGPLQANVRLALPPRPTAAVLASAGITASLLFAGVPVLRSAETELAATRSEVRQLTRQAAELEELEAVVARHRRADEALREEIGRWTELVSSTIPSEHLLPRVLGIFEGRAELTALIANSEEEGIRVRISGLARGGPEQTYATLEAMRTELAATERVLEVELIPPARMPDSDALTFSLDLLLGTP